MRAVRPSLTVADDERPSAAKAGTQVVVPYRDADEARHLKVCGDLGQVVPMEWDLNNDTQIEECLRHSDTVYNLVGRDYTTKCVSLRRLAPAAPVPSC